MTTDTDQTIVCPSAETKSLLGERVTITEEYRGREREYAGVIVGIEAAHTVIRTADGEYRGVKFRIRTDDGRYRTTYTFPDRGSRIAPAPPVSPPQPSAGVGAPTDAPNAETPREDRQ